MEGLVTKNTGSWYIVRTENGDSIRCKIKGNFRLKGIRSTNPVSVGDLVDIELNPDQTAFITRIHERKNYIIRRSSNLSKESHIIAANIEHASDLDHLYRPFSCHSRGVSHTCMHRYQ